MKLYILKHAYNYDGEWSEKNIGVFNDKAKAQKAIEEYWEKEELPKNEIKKEEMIWSSNYNFQIDSVSLEEFELNVIAY